MPIRVGNINQKYGFWNFFKLISDAVETGHALSLQKNPGLFHAGISILKNDYVYRTNFLYRILFGPESPKRFFLFSSYSL